jgi:flavodoxin
MNHVLYYSMTGNTKKMASAIAGELGIDATNIKTLTAVPPNGLLFLGSGSYGDRPSDEMTKFIANNDFAGRTVALFGTSGKGEGKEVEGMAVVLKQKGATVIGSYYTKGKSFAVVNIGHPNRDDLGGARTFAREMAGRGSV